MIIEKLTVNEEASFFFLLKDATDRPELLASFLGILELIKLRRILFCEEEGEEFSILSKFRLNPDYTPDEDEPRGEFDDYTEKKDQDNE